LPAVSAYFGGKKTFHLRHWVRKLNRALKKRPRPERFIGVGYRDQGTCRNTATDASPSWQEVAGSQVEITLSLNYAQLAFQRFYDPWFRQQKIIKRY